MSDEESFVILGSSPTPSMEQYGISSVATVSQQPNNMKSLVSIKEVSHAINSLVTQEENPVVSYATNTQASVSLATSAAMASIATSNTPTNITPTASLRQESVQGTPLLESEVNNQVPSVNSEIDQLYSIIQHCEEGVNGSLNNSRDVAGNFLLGKIDGEALKASIHNYLNDDNKVWKTSQIQNGGSQLPSTPQTSLNRDNTEAALNGNTGMKQKSFEAGSQRKSLNINGQSSFNNAEALKSNIVNRFPSLCTADPQQDDMMRLQNLICEHQELKSNLERTNIAIRHHFSTMTQWQTSVLHFKEEKEMEIESYSKNIAMCRNQIMDLKQELINRDERYNIAIEMAKKENEDLVKELSAKTSVMQNLGSQIAKYEEEMSCFEFVGANKLPEPQTQETIAIIDHQAIVKNLTDQLSHLMAENLDLNYMKSVFNDQVNCLQVNLASTEELLSQTHDDLNQLQEPDVIDKFKKKNDAILGMKAKIVSLESELQDATSKINVTQMEQAKVAEYAAQINQLQSHLTSALEKANTEANSLKSIEQRLERKEDTVAYLQSTIVSTKLMLDSANDEIVSLKSKGPIVSEQLKEKDDTIKGLQRNLVSTGQLLEAARLEVISLKDESVHLKREMRLKDETIRELQLNLVETGERLAKETSAAQAIDFNLENIAKENSNKIKEQESEMEVLRAQLDIYRNDFEIERQSRQDLASEREELLSDLKLLQRRNQQLIEEAQSRSIKTSALANTPNVAAATTFAPPKVGGPSSSPPAVKPATVGQRFICPLCSRTYMQLKALESHVQDCLLNLS